MTIKKNFNVDCPYCNSRVNVRAGRRLKFKAYYFSDPNCTEDTVDRYPNVPTWKCPVCKNRFAVDMFNNRASTLETISAKVGGIMLRYPEKPHLWRFINRGKRMKTNKDEKPTCSGCKHLGYWNSGEPFCTKGIDKACISGGFKFRVEASDDIRRSQEKANG